MQAEQTILEQSVNGVSERSVCPSPPIQAPMDNPKERARAFVSNLPQVNDLNRNITTQLAQPRVDEQSDHPSKNGNQEPVFNSENVARFCLYPCAMPYYQPSELSRFVLKQDLLLSRLRNFTDHPEAYAIWKAGFRNVMVEMQVNDVEELDLLVKWLGPESSRHALSLRAANVHDQVRGLQQVWERLDERYGCPEVAEAALKARLNNFPRLTNKDHKKLYELSDLLAENASVKLDDKYGALLAYFDSSSGVIPIVSKLPYGLQEKWSVHAFKYKERHGVSFPSFQGFVNFVRRTSKLKNNPSFAYGTVANNPPKKEKSTVNSFNGRTAIQAKKTDVTSGSKPEKAEKAEPVMRCLVHNTNHSLNNCKIFKSKSFEERKDLLKRNGMCYNCCLVKHWASTCTEDMRCAECGSSRHPTALHIYKLEEIPSRSNMSKVAPVVGNGREKTDKRAENEPVTSKCTQVCGETFSGKSCAKTILVNVYPQDHPEKSVKLYTILDDQSNSSLAKTELFDIMEIKTDPVPYSLTSCAGVTRTLRWRANGLVIEPLDRSCVLNLPTLIECNDIPDIREEIATPAFVLNHPHLSDIANHIPPIDDSARILLLVGRDMTAAHHVLDQRVGPGMLKGYD